MNQHSTELNIGNLILKRAEIDPSRIAIIFKDKKWTYQELLERVRHLAENLASNGIEPGDRVAYLGLNHPYYFEVMLATLHLGAIFVPLNYRLSGAELKYIINDCSPHTIASDNYHTHLISTIREDIAVERHLVYGESPTSQNQSTSIDKYELIHNRRTPKQFISLYSPNSEDCAIIMYTSGTTGKPKGVMLSHANIMWNNIQACFTYSITAQDTTIVCAPLFHVGGLNVTTLSTFLNGGRVLIHPDFKANEVIQDIYKHKVNTMFAAPAMLQMMAQDELFDAHNMSSLRMVVVGAAPVSKSLLETYVNQDIEINQGYGLTETAPMVSFLTPAYSATKLGSAGKAGLFGEIKISNTEGEELPANTTGEILYKGPNVMLGYWHKNEATQEVISRDGWFHTGDAGYIDEEGFLFISDRIKDMLISGGENIYPAEVEAVLIEHPFVADVAVIGLPHEKWGEAVTAIVVLHEQKELTLEKLRDFAAQKLARYKLPLYLHKIDEMPRNPAGKVQKNHLRERFS